MREAAGEPRATAKMTRALTRVLAGLTLLAGTGYLLQGQEEGIAQLNTWLQSHHIMFCASRTVLVLTVIWRWQPIAHWLYPPQMINAPQKRAWLHKQRWRVLGAFAFIELFIANNLFGTLLRALT